jgi:class 3 adenylate cyclase
VICPTCSFENAAGAKFCAECGTKLTAGCPSCGTVNAPGAKFCNECGTNLVGTPAAAAATGPAPLPATEQAAAAERRLVSVLFADLVGSTSLADDQDPEDTRELLSRYFDVAREIIDRYGGTVEKFIGDAVMAVWGVPVAHEDDAERAVRAGLDLVAAVPHLNEDAPLQARAGVLTGEAAATVGASGQGMIAGDLVNTASRLQGVAAPGTVLVGEATFHAASQAIAFEPAGEHTLKGKAAPVPAWRALNVVALRGGERRASTLEPPFVGREEELRIVRDAFHAASREGKPRLVTLVGQAGIGKSRIAWEFEKYIDGVVEGAYWHEGRSPAYGEGISYWALAEMLRERARIAETDDPAEARAKLITSVEEFVTDATERAWVGPRLAAVLGLETLPGGGKEELFAAWRTFFERMAAISPVILVFEDLQWADEGLMEFIEHLLAWARTSPILVVVLTRPELFERRPNWGSGVRSATSVMLEPLTPEQMREMLVGLAPGLPEETLVAIVERSEGIPLYAVETVRMLIDRGQIAEERGEYRLTESVARLAVPETLHALIAARLDANDPADRALLSDASVLGHAFSPAALEGLTGESWATLEPRLDRLVRRELLIREDDPRSPERGQFRFIQALIRDVAYETLAKRDRRTRHLAAARYYESLGDDELAGVQASHYLEAYRQSPSGPEADAVAAQARIALRAAAERAAGLHSHAGAIRYLEDALSITTDLAEAALLHERAARSGSTTGHAGAVTHAEVARGLYEEAGDPEGALRAVALQAQILNNFSRTDDAVALLQPVADTITEPSPAAASVLAELARSLFLSWQFDNAVAVANRTLEMAGPLGLTEIVADTLVTRSSAVWRQRPEEAEAILRGAILLATREGLPRVAHRGLNNLSVQVLPNATYGEELEIVDAAIDLINRYGLTFMTGYDVAFCDDMILAGDWERSDRALREVEELDLAGSLEATAHGARSLLASFKGDLQTARAEAEATSAALGDIQRADERANLGIVSALASWVAGDFGDATHLICSAAVALHGDMIPLRYGTLIVGSSGDPQLLAQIEEQLADTDPTIKPKRWFGVLSAHTEAVRNAMHGRWEQARDGYLHTQRLVGDLGFLVYQAIIGLEFEGYLGARFAEAASAGAEAEAYLTELGAGEFVRQYRVHFAGTPAPAVGERAAAGEAAATEPASVETNA